MYLDSMITKEKIEIFKYYEGEIDSFGHGSKRDRKIITDYEFLLLVSLAQDIKLMKKHHASSTFELDFERRLQENFDTKETIEEFKKAFGSLK